MNIKDNVLKNDNINLYFYCLFIFQNGLTPLDTARQWNEIECVTIFENWEVQMIH